MSRTVGNAKTDEQSIRVVAAEIYRRSKSYRRLAPPGSRELRRRDAYSQGKYKATLEVDVHADTFHEDRAAILIVARVIDELNIECIKDSAPGVEIVITL